MKNPTIAELLMIIEILFLPFAIKVPWQYQVFGGVVVLFQTFMVAAFTIQRDRGESKRT